MRDLGRPCRADFDSQPSTRRGHTRVSRPFDRDTREIFCSNYFERLARCRSELSDGEAHEHA
jgi:hypothetical protein